LYGTLPPCGSPLALPGSRMECGNEKRKKKKGGKEEKGKEGGK